MTPALPRYIAFSGNPTCGKTTAAEILGEIYGYQLVDDGAPMRDFAMRHLGATWEDVHTQEGKLRKTTVNGVEMEWRAVLGLLGNGLEAVFGGDVIPEMAYRAIPAGQLSIFPSVRREQGFYHRKRGALVIELDNPLALPSPYEFDAYNRKACHITVHNNGLARQLPAAEARADLASKLVAVIGAAESMVRDLAV